MEKLYLTIYTTNTKKVVKVEGEKRKGACEWRWFYGYTTYRTARKMLKKKNVFLKKEVVNDKFIFPDDYRYKILNNITDNYLIS